MLESKLIDEKKQGTALTNNINSSSNKKVYIDLTTVGSGNHTFNYPDIVVTISGPTGLGSTVSPSYYNATADAVIKGQTVSSSFKPAIVNNNVRVMVPGHIEVGSKIIIRPEDGTYVEKAKT